MEIKELHGADLRRFMAMSKKPELTLSYLTAGCCYGVISNFKLVAGYCLTHAPLDEMISIQQIPAKERKGIGNEDPFKYAEISSLFIGKKHRLSLKIHLVTKIMFHKAEYFVYSYPTDQTLVENLVSIGRPLRLYCGKPKLTIGGEGILLPASINVEILSKLGVANICLHQIKKKFKKYIRTLVTRLKK